MDREKTRPEDLLLQWHLNILEDDASAWLEAELHKDAQLRAQSGKLARILRPLDYWSVSPGPARLAENVLEAVRSAALPAGFHARPRGWFPSFKLRELAAVAACVVVLLGVFVPGSSALRARSQRVLCAGNLHDISEGLSSYQASYAGALPFAGFARNASWLPRGDGGEFASNSRHVFLLLKLGFVPKAPAFLCPSAKGAVAMNSGDLTARHDFAEKANICYDSYNLAGGSPSLRPQPDMAYLSDANPLFIGARFHGDIDPQRANSPAHGGCGQTVLLLDGRAEYFRSPVYGSHQDNVWVIEGVRRYTGAETPIRADDAFLVPGFPTERSLDLVTH